MPVHSGPAGIEQDRAVGPVFDGTVDGASDGGRQRDQHDFRAFAADCQHAVTMLFAKVSDVGAGGFEDPQAKQPEHRDQGEVARVWRLAADGEHSFELQVHVAAGNGDLALAQRLLDIGADPNIRRPSRGSYAGGSWELELPDEHATPLDWARRSGHQALIDLLEPRTQA